MHVKLNL